VVLPSRSPYAVPGYGEFSLLEKGDIENRLTAAVDDGEEKLSLRFCCGGDSVLARTMPVLAARIAVVA